MAKKENEVAKVTPQSTAVAPSFMKDDRGMGTENIGAEDIGLPRLALLQALSPQVQAGEGKPGEFYHLMTDTNLGSNLKFIPITVSRSFMLWRPRESGGGLLARADDGIHWSPSDAEFQVQLKSGKQVIWKTAKTVKESGLDQWGSSDPGDTTSLPAATRMMNVLVYLPDYPELSPVVLTLQRSSLKPGKKFLGKLKLATVAAFGLKFEMTSELVQGKLGAYQAPAFTGIGYNEDEKLYNTLKEMCEHFQSTGIKVSEKGLQDEGAEGTEAPADHKDDDRY